MKNKKNILIVVLVVILLVSGIGYTLYINYNLLFVKKVVPQVVSTVANNVATSSMSSATSTAGITYTSIDLYKEGENSASYIKIQGGVPDSIKDRINTELFKRSSCFAQSDEALRDELLHVYDFPVADTKPLYTKADISKMNTETLRKNLFLYGLYDESSNQEVVYVDKNLFSVEGHYQNYCGGAYPNSGVDAMNFDLQTGKEISFAGLFKDFEKDKPAIKRAILKSLQETGSFDPSAECPTDGLNLDIEWIESTLTKEGFKIESLGYPHVAQACEPASTVIPYKVLLSYMNTSLPYLKVVLNVGTDSKDKQFSFVGEKYSLAKSELLTQGWKVDLSSTSAKSSSVEDKNFPEIDGCGSGIDAVCSVRFKKADKALLLYVQTGGRSPKGPYSEWTIIDQE